MTTEVEGAPPSARGERLKEISKELSPGASLARIDETVKAVVAGAASVGLVLTAFGALDAADVVGTGPSVVALALTAFALVAAAIASIPRLGRMRTGDLAEVDRIVGRLVWRRGVAALAAALCLVAAYVAAIAGFMTAHAPVARPSLTIIAGATGQVSRVVVIVPEAERGTSAHLRLISTKAGRFMTQDFTALQREGNSALEIRAAVARGRRVTSAALRVADRAGDTISLNKFSLAVP